MTIARRQLPWLALAAASTAQAHDDEHPPAIARTALIHGMAGPFAVAGYRMGEHALSALGLRRGGMDIEVVHYSPLQVQWTCIVDGLQAATGASLGKMNLKAIEAAEVYSMVVNRKTGRRLRYELAPPFLKANLNLPENKLFDAGLRAVEMKDMEVFVVR